MGTKSPLRWIGGKFLLAPQIVALMPPHVCYCELFCGAAHVLFRKEPSPIEVVNDINGELVNFWRVLGSPGGLDWLAARHKWAVYSREECERLRSHDPAKLTGHERAWRFLYLNRCSFGSRGMHDGGRPTFGTEKTKPRSSQVPSFARLLPVLEKAHQRMAAVCCERLGWEDCLARYDGPQTLFYLDPPYYGHEDYYGRRVFAREDFARLVAALAGIQGKFLLSVNDRPETRALFGAFPLLLETGVGYSLNRDDRVCKGELVFANFRRGESPRGDFLKLNFSNGENNGGKQGAHS